MSEAFLIMLREGFEATLVVAIVFTYLRKIGLVVPWTIGELEGNARLVAFASSSLIAAAGKGVLLVLRDLRVRQPAPTH